MDVHAYHMFVNQWSWANVKRVARYERLKTRLFLSDCKESRIDPSHARRVRWVGVQVLTKNRVRARQQTINVSHGVPEMSD